jgi:hypothetical protein
MLVMWTVLRYRDGTYLVADDWTMLGSRLDYLQSQGIDEFLLRPHNGHLMGGMILWNHALAELFGLRSYLPWLIMVQLGNLLVVWVLFRTMKALGVSPVLAAFVSPLFLVWPSLTAVSYWAPESIFAVSVVLVVVHGGVVAMGEASLPRDLVGAASSTAALFLHSASIIAIPAVLLVAAVRRRHRSLAVSMLPAGLYVIWAGTYGRMGEPNRWLRVPDGEIWPADTPRRAGSTSSFLWRMFGRTIQVDPSRVASTVMVAAISAAVLVCWRSGGTRRLYALGSVVAAFGFLAAVAWMRATLFEEVLEVPPPSRYAAVLVVLFLPVCTLAVQHVLVPVWSRRQLLHSCRHPMLIVLPVIALLSSATVRARSDSDWSSGTRLQQERIIALATAPDLSELDQGEFVFGDDKLIDLQISDVSRFVRRGWL